MRAKTFADDVGMGTRHVSLREALFSRSRLFQLGIALILTALLALQFGGFLQSSASEPGENIVINGSFEEPIVLNPALWDSFPGDGVAVPGWFSIAVDESIPAPIEIMRGQYGPAYDGSQYAELDSNGNLAAIYQDLETIPGTVYRVEFAFSPRPFRDEADNRMSVDWAGEELVSVHELSADGSNLDSTDWSQHSRIAVASGDVTRIQFNYEGVLNTFGVFLDDVRVFAVTCESTGFAEEWNDPATWQCSPGGSGIPGAGNDVVITAGTTVVLAADQAANNVWIQSGSVLDNTGGHTLEVHGDWILDGEYLVSENGDDEVHFKGDKNQKIDGSKESEFNNLKVEKKKKQSDDPDPELDVKKKILVKKKLTLEEGKTKLGDADLTDVEIKEHAKLEGKDGTTKSYKGDKTVDGEYDPKQSKDEFIGDKDQTIKGETHKQQKLVYHELLIKKQNKPLGSPNDDPEKSTAEFEKDLKIEQKTTIEEGKTKVGNAEFNDIEIKDKGELEGTPEKTKTYTGDKTVDGKYKHNNSIDEYKGDRKQKVDTELQLPDDQKKELQYYKLKIEKEQEPAEFHEKIKLKVEQETTLEKGEMKTHGAEFQGNVEIKQEAKLSGSQDSTQTFYKDKKVDGEFDHNQSKTEFKGDENQKIDGETEKQEKLEYFELLIKKEQEKQASFEKNLKVEQKTTVDEGNLKTENAEFEGDVEIKENAKLEGTEDTTKTYKGDKTVDGEYEHKKSKDEFIGDKDQKVTSEDEARKLKAIEYYKLLLKKEQKESQEQSKVEFEKKLKVEQETTLEEGKTKVGDAEFNKLEIKEHAELEGTPEKTKTYNGDKTIDGKYTHNESNDEFTGKEDQKITSSTETLKEKQVEYYELLIKKEQKEDQQQSEVEFEKSLKVEQKTTIEEGILKTNTVFGEVVIDEDGVLILGEDDDPTEVLGDWINNGEFQAGTGTVIFNGDQPQSISGSSLTTFNNLSIDNNTVLNTSIKIEGTLKLSGTLSLGSEGSIEQGDDFRVEVESGGNLGLGCVDPGLKLTGGGWFQSPAGAYLSDPALSGPADFGLSVHCGDAGAAPTGSVSFSFMPVGFESTEIDSMLVLGNQATVTGHGTINGTGDYGFALVAVEGAPGNSGDPNRLRMVIWNSEDGETIYDSQVNGEGPINTGGGNVKIHQPSGGGPPGHR